jgi:hypothetical protein
MLIMFASRIFATDGSDSNASSRCSSVAMSNRIAVADLSARPIAPSRLPLWESMSAM